MLIIVIVALYEHIYKRNEHNYSLWLHIKEMPPRTTVTVSLGSLKQLTPSDDDAKG